MIVRSLGSLVCLAVLMLAAAASAAAAPSNDDFGNALLATGDQVEAAGNNFGASKQSGEPAHDGDPGGASVWFGWTAPRSQTVFVRLCTETWHGRLGIYRGDAVDQLVPIAAADDASGDPSCGEVRFRAVSSLTYRFAVDGSTSGGGVEEGNFSLEISAVPREPPSNDAFAGAAVVKPTSYGYLFGSTEEASREPGEPGHGGDLAGASVWFRWTAPETREMRIYPCKAGFRPTISVYAGASLATLRTVGRPAAADASLPSECQLGGLGGTGFDAVAGETYSIVVDSDDGSVGRFQLRLLPAVVPFVDIYPPNTYIYKLLRLRRNGIAIQFGSGGGSGPVGDSFLCRLDRQPFKPCKTPRKWHNLAPGTHRVAVVATDAGGNRDKTPATRSFKMGGG